MVVSRNTTPASRGSPIRATTPGLAAAPGAITDDKKSVSKNVIASEARPRDLGRMTATLPPLKAGVRWLVFRTLFGRFILMTVQRRKLKDPKPAATVQQTSRETRSVTNSLPGKPKRLVEDAMLQTPKKTAYKIPKTIKPKGAATPKAMKPAVTKVTKKSPAKPKAKLTKANKGAAAKGKQRPRMAEETTSFSRRLF